MIQIPGLTRYGSGRQLPLTRIIALAVVILLILTLLLREKQPENEVAAVAPVHLSTTENLAKVFHLKQPEEGSNEAGVDTTQEKEHTQQDVVPAKSKEEVAALKDEDKSGKGVAGPKWTKHPAFVMPDPRWEGWDAIENFFVFGDSTTDTGFLLSNDSKLPTPQNPFGNHDRVPEKTFAPKWPHFLAATYNQSSMMVWNLAWDGSTTDKDVVDTWGLASSLKQEVERFSTAMGGEITVFPAWESRNSLFAVSIGVNDINLTSGDETTEETAPIDASINAYRASLDKLYELGARNFLILNSPALHLARKDAPPALERDILEFNYALEVMRADFVRAHKEHLSVFFFNLHGFMEDIAAQPKILPHTKNITSVESWMGSCNSCIFKEMYDEQELECNDDPVHEHMFCDNFHPTYVLYNATAATIATDCFQQTKARQHPQGYCS